MRRIGLVLLVVAAGLFAEWLRGHYALKQWMAEMTAKGEILEAESLWPRPTAQGLDFSNRFQQATAQLPPGLGRYAGQLEAMVVPQPGFARRGSQEPQPVFHTQAGTTNDWEDLAAQVRAARPALRALQALLERPPADMGCDVRAIADQLHIPNFINLRQAAQAFQTAAISDLHRGDLAAAKADLAALGAFTQLYAGDPTLVNYMIHIAIVGLTVPAGWDAIQAGGWTESDLAELQAAFQFESLLARMPRTVEAERVGRLHELDWFASHSFDAWVGRYAPIRQAFGQPLSSSRADQVAQCYQQWFFHPLWQFAWADQEILEYLKSQQAEVEYVR